jgi:hypothetical protein
MAAFTGNLVLQGQGVCVHSDHWTAATDASQLVCSPPPKDEGSCCALQGDGVTHAFSGMSGTACGWLGGTMGACTTPPPKPASKLHKYLIIGGSVLGGVIVIILCVALIPGSSTPSSSTAMLAPPGRFTAMAAAPAAAAPLAAAPMAAAAPLAAAPAAPTAAPPPLPPPSLAAAAAFPTAMPTM